MRKFGKFYVVGEKEMDRLLCEYDRAKKYKILAELDWDREERQEDYKDNVQEDT